MVLTVKSGSFRVPSHLSNFSPLALLLTSEDRIGEHIQTVDRQIKIRNSFTDHLIKLAVSNPVLKLELRSSCPAFSEIFFPNVQSYIPIDKQLPFTYDHNGSFVASFRQF